MARPGRPVRVVLLGNSFASQVQLPSLRWAGGNEVAGIAGADADKAARTAREWDIPHATGDWSELLALDPDLAIVTTPVDLHAPMVAALCARTSAAILCEKPFTLNAAQAVPLVDVARGRLALIDHQLRWSPWRRKITELLREGFIGEPWSARVTVVFGSRTWRDAPWSWWYDAARGGGALGAIASHHVDALALDLGAVRRVRARLATYVPERVDADGVRRAVTADEHATLWLDMASGAQVSLEVNLMAPGGSGSLLEYVGSEGTLRLVDSTNLLAARHGEQLSPVEVAPCPTHAELGVPERGIFARVLPLYLRDLVGSVAAGADELLGAATFADGLATMGVLDAARRSAAAETWEPVQA